MGMQLGSHVHPTINLHSTGCAPRPPILPFLDVGRRRCLTCSAAASDTSASTPAGVRLLAQQYQGLVTPVKSKPISGNSTDSKRTTKARSQQPAKNVKKSSSTTAGTGTVKPRLSQPQRGTKLASTTSRSQQKQQSTTHSSSSSSSSKKSNNSSSGNASGQKTSAKQKPDKQSAAPPPTPPQPPVLLGKGFGSVTATTTSSSSSSGTDSSNSKKSSKPLKLFRFGVTASAIDAAIQANRWESKVQQVDQLSDADVLVAVSCTPGGKHQNLKQGERSAANANIPFVVIGRRASKELFYKALSPLLGVQTPAEKAAAAEEARKAAENKAFADQWFKTANKIRWGGVEAANVSAAAKPTAV